MHSVPTESIPCAADRLVAPLAEAWILPLTSPARANTGTAGQHAGRANMGRPTRRTVSPQGQQGAHTRIVASVPGLRRTSNLVRPARPHHLLHPASSHRILPATSQGPTDITRPTVGRPAGRSRPSGHTPPHRRGADRARDRTIGIGPACPIDPGRGQRGPGPTRPSAFVRGPWSVVGPAVDRGRGGCPRRVAREPPQSAAAPRSAAANDGPRRQTRADRSWRSIAERTRTRRPPLAATRPTSRRRSAGGRGPGPRRGRMSDPVGPDGRGFVASTLFRPGGRCGCRASRSAGQWLG